MYIDIFVYCIFNLRLSHSVAVISLVCSLIASISSLIFIMGDMITEVAILVECDVLIAVVGAVLMSWLISLLGFVCCLYSLALVRCFLRC